MPSFAGIGRISGELITTPEEGKVVTEPTVMCAHCGRNWIPRKGSGIRRGVCLCCYGYTCGAPECDQCVPLELQIENMEAGRPLDYRPIRAVGGYAPPDNVSAGGIILGA